jgi:hypothetical protein
VGFFHSGKHFKEYGHRCTPPSSPEMVHREKFADVA